MTRLLAAVKLIYHKTIDLRRSSIAHSVLSGELLTKKNNELHVSHDPAIMRDEFLYLVRLRYELK